jgi:hypothetical protein
MKLTCHPDGGFVVTVRAAAELPGAASAMVVAGTHTCVPQPSGIARCVGGAFGPAISGTADGFDVPGFTPELAQLGVGYWLLCGLTDDGVVECAGLDDQGAVSGFFPGIAHRVLSLGPWRALTLVHLRPRAAGCSGLAHPSRGSRPRYSAFAPSVARASGSSASQTRCAFPPRFSRETPSMSSSGEW